MTTHVRRAAVFVIVLLIAPTLALPQAPPAFDVTSVKRNTSGETRIRFETPPGRVTAINVPVRFVIRQAYRISESRIVGGPSWAGTDRFDILATAAAGGATPDITRQMLRSLLAERFGFVSHTEVREIPIYSLIVAADDGTLGPNLRRSTTDCAGRGAAMVAGRVQCGILVSQGPASASLRGGAATLTEFVRLLADFLDRPLEDHTGLTGTFDLELQFRAERSALPGSAVPGGLSITAPTDDIPSVFAAVQEQLGLRLEARRGTTEVLVVDRVARPSEN